MIGWEMFVIFYFKRWVQHLLNKKATIAWKKLIFFFKNNNLKNENGGILTISLQFMYPNLP